MCNKHFILSAKCISKKARSKYIKPHDQFCRVPCPMEYEPDLDLVYQGGGNLTETRPYPVHIWQETDNNGETGWLVERQGDCHDPV